MKVGDRVVCVKSVFKHGTGVVKNQTYLILDEWSCKCNTRYFNVGLPFPNITRICECDACGGFCYFVACRSALFAPLSYNSAHDELINKEIVEEKADIKIKEPEKTGS